MPNFSRWTINPRNGVKIFTTAGGLVFDITGWEVESSLEGYSKLSLRLDIENHNHFVDCGHCNGKLQCYNDYKGFALCERCVAIQHIGVTAENLKNPWFDFMAGILKPKLRPPICEPMFA